MREILRLRDIESRRLGRGRFNSALQAELGHRGGTIGGSRNTAAQFQQRQQMGRTYGRTTGLANQSPRLRAFLGSISFWIRYQEGVIICNLPKRRFD